ncbi:MAG TPA: ImmA/IrrE family metallo-endopeptidase [Marmoricola sp.]|nr:ImmA/IrrE family metallo-endopeptidase [Marmoricola sp.]
MADRAGGPAELSYDPYADLAHRYPDWVVVAADLGGLVPEVLSVARRVVLLEREQSQAGLRCSLAHAVAHLDLGHAHTIAGFFESREEADADALAAVRLIPLSALAGALSWTRDRTELASELHVDAQMLRARERDLSRVERRALARGVRRLAATA